MAETIHTKISITGDLGSGKSTISRIFSEKIKCKTYSTGGIQRDIAKKFNMSTLELNKYSETHPEIDDEIDSFTKELNLKKESFIIDSRMAWHFIPNSFKVSLLVKPTIATKRILNDLDRVSEKTSSFEKTLQDLKDRKKSEVGRFKKLYNVECENPDNFNLIIDTSYSDPVHIVDLIIEQHQKWQNGIQYNKYWVSPKVLYPTQHVISLSREDSIQLNETIKENGFDCKFPVEIVDCKGFMLIWDGHKRTSASLFNNFDLIPIKVLDSETSEIMPGLTSDRFCSSNINLSWIYDWEDCHKFRFDEYPTAS